LMLDRTQVWQGSQSWQPAWEIFRDNLLPVTLS